MSHHLDSLGYNAMSQKRAHISLKTKLASALLAIKAFELGRWSPLIPHADAKQMTADQIISLFAFDHYPIRKADGGPDEPWNLEPRMIAAHRTKTAKIDVPEMAKSKRICRKEAVHQERRGVTRALDMQTGTWPMSTDSFADLDRPMGFMTRKRKIPSRINPWPKRKLKSNKPRN